ncbi:uncharacterized acetyltransferase At3g50280-like [Lolium rigidum]|uniref:uncharacterized acetyltransferase At3g50280-like n=1 Tax=Lolium rigidum TaxID=89674 RepID=UPI001F5D10CF|nr:uncharacterized acetyltransferase At3g50280-like [Lolium rigidum]
MGNEQMEAGAAEAVRIVSRRMVQPPMEEEEVVDIQVKPCDLRLITVDYIQKGILLPKPPAGGERLVDTLAVSFVRALAGRFYSLAGRLVVKHHTDETISVVLRCTGEGAEFVHAVAPGVTVEDIAASVYTPSVVRDFYPFNHVLGADAAIKSLPVLAVQVTELDDGIFIGLSMNHCVGDGTTFWAFFNAWSGISRGGNNSDDLHEVSKPAPVIQLQKWFADDGSPVPVHMPFSKLQDVVRRFERPAVEECLFTFSAASIRKLKARANNEIAGTANVTISSLQALLAHLWRAVSRARQLPPGQETSYSMFIGCRGRVNGMPQGYIGNAVVLGKATSAVGEILEKGLGWTAWQLNRLVASFDEAAMEDWLDRWIQAPDFEYMGRLSSGGAALMTGSSPRFDVFGNDFGWGKPIAVRSGPGDKMDGKATVFEGPERGGSMSLEVCVAPDVLKRLVADMEFMESVSMPM